MDPRSGYRSPPKQASQVSAVDDPLAGQSGGQSGSHITGQSGCGSGGLSGGQPLDFSEIRSRDAGSGLPPVGPGDDVTPQIEGYQIGRRIGRGGMGTVWSATHLGTRQVVALKVMNMATVGCDKAKGWFEREIKLAARLDHPNIAPVYDTGVARGKYFYTMKLIDGVPLDRYVEKFSPHPSPDP